MNHLNTEMNHKAGGIVNHWTRILNEKKTEMFMDMSNSTNVYGLQTIVELKLVKENMKDVVKKMDKLKESVETKFSIKLKRLTTIMVAKVKSQMK